MKGEGPRLQNPTVRFVNRDDREIDRHWYHVPRAGEYVWVEDMQGVVKQVFWYDDVIEVHLV